MGALFSSSTQAQRSYAITHDIITVPITIPSLASRKQAERAKRVHVPCAFFSCSCFSPPLRLSRLRRIRCLTHSLALPTFATSYYFAFIFDRHTTAASLHPGIRIALPNKLRRCIERSSSP
jgi:hypothetical protein